MQIDQIIPIVLTLWGVVIATLTYIDRRKEKKTKRNLLSFYPLTSTNILNDIDSFSKDLRIEYKNSPITNNLLYFNGILINNGSNDIGGEKNKVKIKLPKSFKWIETVATSKSTYINSDMDIIDETEAEISFDTFKKGAYIKITALIESADKKSSYEINSIPKRLIFENDLVQTDVQNIFSMNFAPNVLKKKAIGFLFLCFVPVSYISMHALSIIANHEEILEGTSNYWLFLFELCLLGLSVIIAGYYVYKYIKSAILRKRLFNIFYMENQ